MLSSFQPEVSDARVFVRFEPTHLPWAVSFTRRGRSRNVGGRVTGWSNDAWKHMGCGRDCCDAGAVFVASARGAAAGAAAATPNASPAHPDDTVDEVVCGVDGQGRSGRGQPQAMEVPVEQPWAGGRVERRRQGRQVVLEEKHGVKGVVCGHGGSHRGAVGVKRKVWEERWRLRWKWQSFQPISDGWKSDKLGNSARVQGRPQWRWKNQTC